MSASRQELKRKLLQRKLDQRASEQVSPTTQFAGGVNQALIDIAGFPVDLINKGLGLVGAGANKAFGTDINLESERPIGGSEQMTDAARKGVQLFDRETGEPSISLGGMVKPEGAPETGPERMGRVVGASLPGFGAIGTAARLGKAGGIFKPMVESFAKRPRTISAVEAVSAGGAAVGGEIGREVGGGDSETGQIIGEIIGGISAPAAITLASNFPIARLAERVTQPLRKGAQKKLAGKVLEDATGDRALALAKKPDFIPLEGTQFTLGEKLNDQNLITLEQAVAKKIPSLADDMVKNKEATNRAISKALNEFTGKVNGVDTKSRTVQLFQSVKSRLKNAMNARMAGVVKNSQDEIRKLRAENTRPDISRIVNDELTDALGDVRTQERFLWDQLDETSSITLRHAKESFDQFVGKETPVPQFVRDFMKFDDIKTVDFKQVKEFRTNLLNVQKQARSSGRPDIAFFLQKVNEGVLDDIANSSLSDDFNLAVDFSRELNKRFTKGRIGKALKFTPKGDRAVQETSVSESLFPSNPVRSAEGFEKAMQATAPMPGVEGMNRQGRMTAAVEDLIKSRLFDSSGEFNTTAARTMLTKRGEFLNNFPELGNQIKTAVGSVDAQDALKARLKVARGNLKDKSKSALGLITNTRPDEVMPRIMSNQNRKRLLTQAVRKTKAEDMEAFRGLQDGYMDELFKHGTTGQVNASGESAISGKRLSEYFDATLKDIESAKLFDKGQISRLKNIIKNAKAFESAGTNEQQIQKLLQDHTNFLNDFIIRVIGANIGGDVSRQLSGRSTLVAQTAGSKVARKIAESLPQESLIQVLGNAVRDESLYKELLSIDTSKPLDVKRIQRIHSWLMGMGIEVPELAENSTQSQEQ